MLLFWIGVGAGILFVLALQFLFNIWEGIKLYLEMKDFLGGSHATPKRK